ncbi:hypothetical protein HK101_010992 [Irineochytrium annulatum]|nr:hypothetical protein HK101_010992 [Irineochytrium annulatum]
MFTSLFLIASATAAMALPAASPVAATGLATVTGTFKSGYMPGGWCSAAGQLTTQLSMIVQVSATNVPANTACPSTFAHLPMAECGLPTFAVSVTQNGAPVQIVSYNGVGSVVAGNMFMMTLKDDNPYYGGTLVMAIPCSYTGATTPAQAGAGVTFSYTVANPSIQVQLTDGTTVPGTFAISPASN